MKNTIAVIITKEKMKFKQKGWAEINPNQVYACNDYASVVKLLPPMSGALLNKNLRTAKRKKKMIFKGF